MGPGPREGAGACSFAARAGGGGCWERPRRIRRGAMIPAARRRRLSGKRLGRRSAASGDSAPAGGLVQRGCAPHCRRRKVRSAPFPPAAKTAPAPLRLLSPPRGARRGSAYRCLLRFGLADRHAILFCEVGTAVPWRMVRRSTGCKNAFDQLLFPRVPLRYALLWRAWGHLYGDAKGHSSVRRGRCPHRPAVGAAITHRTAAVSGMHI